MSADRILDEYPPEHVADAVRRVLNVAVAAAIENWDEGFWEDFSSTTTTREIYRNFIGFVASWLETVEDDDDPDMARPFIQ